MKSADVQTLDSISCRTGQIFSPPHFSHLGPSRMPKRIIDGEAVWKSKKLNRCREEHRVEYTWLYMLADANGNFELDYRAIYNRVSIIRPSFHFEDLKRVLEDFIANGLLFTWTENGNEYGHWTGCEKLGLLPALKHRERYGISVNRTFQLGDPEVAAYIAECAARPEAQTMMFDETLARNAQVEARKKAAEAHAKALESDPRIGYWRQFWQNFPSHRRGDESETRRKFFALGILECERSIGLLEAWKQCDEWTRDSGRWIPMSDNGFFTDAKFRSMPPPVTGKESDHGNRRTFGPAARTAEDKFERFIKNAKSLGLLHR